MKLDLDLLVMRLIGAEEGSVLPPAGCCQYLVDHVYLPLLRGEPVEFGSLDYDAFGLEDIRALCDYNEFVYRMGRTMEQVMDKLADTRPTARPVRQFC